MKLLLMHEMVAVSLIALAGCSDAAGPASELDSLLTLDVAMVSADAVIAEVAEQALDGGVDGTVTYYDGQGNVQEAYDEVTTASIHILRESSHEGSRDSWSGTVTRTREITITGLEGDETTRTVNGTGSSTVVTEPPLGR